MDFSTFIVVVFNFTYDWLTSQDWKVRQRGPKPTLHDSEVLTMEVVGTFLGIEQDKALYLFFRRHYGDWFPGLRQIHRTTFVRQAANLWWVKLRLWQALLTHIELDPALSIIDSVPVPICQFARATRCRRLRECAEFGYDHLARQTFLGLRAHVRIAWPGVITGLELTPANVHETAVAEQLLDDVSGWALGDRNYWNPELTDRLAQKGLILLAPFRLAKREPKPWPTWLKHKRYRIETVFSQLVDRFRVKRVWARDAWHLASRWLRLLVTHSFAVMLCQQAGLSPLRFSELITD